MVLEKTLERPLDCKKFQPVHSKEINPGISLEEMMLKLKLQYFVHHNQMSALEFFSIIYVKKSVIKLLSF